MNHSTSSVSLSVCLPTYNPGEYLAPAVRSVLDQDFQALELLVLDDSSTTPVARLLGDFKDARLTVLRNEHNLGIPGNWNRCVQLARGKYIAIFHQDDLMLPGNLSQKVVLLDQNPTVGFVYSDVQCIDQAGQVTGGHHIPQPEQDLIMPGCKLFEMVALTGNPVACPSVIARSQCYQHLGLFSTLLPFATDLEMWLRIAAHYDVGFVAQPLIAQRKHAQQETARFSESGRDYLDVWRALSIVYSRQIPDECAKHRRMSYRTLASQALPMLRWKLRQGRIKPAFRYALVALLCVGKMPVPRAKIGMKRRPRN
jgi:glycosyltransferase involved in cell wall biosynthesis